MEQDYNELLAGVEVNLENEKDDRIEFEGRKVFPKFEPLVKIIQKSSADYADVLRKEMFLHEEHECSCYYNYRRCLVGDFVENKGSVYDMNEKVERLIKRNQLHRYKGFVYPVHDDDYNMLHADESGINSFYMGAYRDVKDKYDFLKRTVGEENIDVQKVYEQMCDEHTSITPYAVACAMGLEDELFFGE